MRRTGLVVVLLGLLAQLVPAVYYAGTNILEIWNDLDLDTYVTITKVTTGFNLAGVLLLIVGVLMLLAAKAPASGSAYPPAPQGYPDPGRPQTPPPRYLA